MSDELISTSLRMKWSTAPWDEMVFGFPVLQITNMEVLGANAKSDIQVFERERDRIGAGMVSCRLAHQCMRESMLLEDRGFRFIEMLFQPELELSKQLFNQTDFQMSVRRAGEDDMPILSGIASTSFRNERFLMDPRIDPDASDQRYKNWVASSRQHASQELYVIRDDEKIVAFFVTEMQRDLTCYWHLNAVAPEFQGKGYGRKAWLLMLKTAAQRGAQRVRSSIVARNYKVLNLYASLGFNFLAPAMTFHWVKPGK